MCKNKRKYDSTKTGKRIKDCRKDICKSQDEFLRKFAGKLNISRSTLSKWENGEGELTVWELLELCNIFDCDSGFLLGEYDEKKGVVSNIRAEIGLPEDAIITLMEIVQEAPPIKDAVYTFLDDLLDDMEFINLAIAYKKRKDGFYSGQNSYFIADETGKCEALEIGDLAMVLLQNSFNRIVNCASTGRKSEFGRSAQRKYWNSLTEEEKADILEKSAQDVKRGK